MLPGGLSEKLPSSLRAVVDTAGGHRGRARSSGWSSGPECSLLSAQQLELSFALEWQALAWQQGPVVWEGLVCCTRTCLCVSRVSWK